VQHRFERVGAVQQAQQQPLPAPLAQVQREQAQAQQGERDQQGDQQGQGRWPGAGEQAVCRSATPAGNARRRRRPSTADASAGRD
jgi:hypothetical protein